MRVIELLKQNTVILVILITVPGFTPGVGNVLGNRVDSYNAPAQEDFASGNPATQSNSRSEYWEYSTQSGDTLEVIAARFQVGLNDIDRDLMVPADQLLDPGIILGIKRPRLDSPLQTARLPDTEVIFSPSTKGFSTRDYVASIGGYLNSHQEYMRSTGLTAAAEIIQRVAVENSIHPRLLLALLEFQCGCVMGPLGDGMAPENLMGIQDQMRRGLYRQLGWTVNQLSMGYYGWRQGLIHHLVLLDGSVIPLPPDLNAGSAAVTYLFSQLADRDRWDRAMGPKQGFVKIHQELFPEIWQAGYDAREIFPPGLSQPDMILPFEVDREWSYTSGPHPAWETEGATAALDFAPASERYGCEPSPAWVLATADGMVARSEHNALVLDLDGDGQEGTGWALLYMHLADYQRAPAGRYLERGDPVGHPSCEGGPADGTHIHLARKFNGEWIAAGGPLPFVMSGWVAQTGFRPYDGSLIRGDQVVRANPLSPAAAFIARSSDDALREARISHGLWWEE